MRSFKGHEVMKMSNCAIIYDCHQNILYYNPVSIPCCFSHINVINMKRKSVQGVYIQARMITIKH